MSIVIESLMNTYDKIPPTLSWTERLQCKTGRSHGDLKHPAQTYSMEGDWQQRKECTSRPMGSRWPSGVDVLETSNSARWRESGGFQPSHHLFPAPFQEWQRREGSQQLRWNAETIKLKRKTVWDTLLISLLLACVVRMSHYVRDLQRSRWQRSLSILVTLSCVILSPLQEFIRASQNFNCQTQWNMESAEHIFHNWHIQTNAWSVTNTEHKHFKIPSSPSFI